MAFNALMGGDPHAGEEEIARQDWGDVFTPDYLNPDWSAESFDKAGQDIEQTWKDTGRTVLTEGEGGERSEVLKDALGISDDQWNQALDDTFGPSPEEERLHDEYGFSRPRASMIFALVVLAVIVVVAFVFLFGGGSSDE